MRFALRRTDLRSGLAFLGVGLAVAVSVLVAAGQSANSGSVSNTQYDILYRRFPRTVPIDDRLVLFEVDDRTLAELEFPIPRARHAELLHNLAEVGVRATFWDFVFVGKQDDDATLAASMEEIPTFVSVGVRRTGTKAPPIKPTQELQGTRFRVGLLPSWDVAGAESTIQSTDTLLRAVAGGGHVMPSVDSDGVFRRVSPIVHLTREDVFVPALGFRAALAILGINPADVSLESGALVLGTGANPIRVPLDDQNRMLLDFPSDWRDRKANYLDSRDYLGQLHSLAEPEGRDELRPGLAGRTVFVGHVATAASDFVAVPWANERRHEPGVMVSIALANAILTQSFLHVAPAWLWTALVVLASLVVAMAWWRLRPLLAAGVTLAVLLSLPLLSIALFAGARTFLPIAGPFVAASMTGAMLTVVSLTRTQARLLRIADVLSRFVSPALLKELEEVALRDNLPPARRAELSVLFIDVAGFTAFTEGQEPETLSAFLDRFYELAMEELFKHGGTLEKFMGDGLLAYFGAPNPLPDKERCAVAVAMAIRDRFAALDAERVARGGAPLAIRCGVATGWVAVGYFGGGNRGTYGVIGRSVNLAARIQGHADPGGILVDRATAARLEGAVPTRPLPPILLKGIAKPVEVFAVATSVPGAVTGVSSGGDRPVT